jgi:hypothetical protein
MALGRSVGKTCRAHSAPDGEAASLANTVELSERRGFPCADYAAIAIVRQRDGSWLFGIF